MLLKWTVKSILKDIGYQCELLLHALTRERSSKEPQIRYNAEGAISPDHIRPVCLFSSYDGASIVSEGVYHYLRRLKMAGFDTVFISTSAVISELDLKKLAGYCIRIISRENSGYDFYSWKVGLTAYPQYHEHAGLLLANDSVCGPLFDFGDIITRLENHDADIVGMTDSFRYYPHLQSYFLYCKSPVALSKEFINFFKNIKVIQLKSAVVRKYEIGFARILGKKFRLAALYPLEGMLNQATYFEQPKSEIDPTFQLWKPLVTKFKFPFLKRSLLTKRGVNIHEITLALAESGSDYDANMLTHYVIEPAAISGSIYQARDDISDEATVSVDPVKTWPQEKLINICFVSHSAGRHGAEKVLVELILGLRKRGVICHVILPKRGPLGVRLSELDIPYKIIPYLRWMKVKEKMTLWGRIIRTILGIPSALILAMIIIHWRCNVVYSNTTTVLIGALAAKISGRTHIWHIHEFGYDDQRLIFDYGEKVSGWLMNYLSAFFVVNSYAVADRCKHYLSEYKIKTIYCSVAMPIENTVIHNKHAGVGQVTTCAIIGSLNESKGHEDAIRAVAELNALGIHIQLLIVGDSQKSAYKDYLHRLISDNELAGQVTFLGYLDNPFLAIHSASIVLVCSRLEAFGLVTIEAMYSGKVVIGARSGGTAELIQNGVTGYLYSPDDYKDLAAKIRFLIERPADLLRVKEAAKKWTQGRFTNERFSGEVLSILHAAIISEKLSHK